MNTSKPPRAKKLADPKGTRALVDRIRTTNPNTGWDEPYSVAMSVVEDYVRVRLRRGK